MVQLKTGGAYGVIETLEGKKALVLLETEPFLGEVTLTAGEKTSTLSGGGELTFELDLEEEVSAIELTASDENGDALGFKTPEGVEHEKITLDTEVVIESIGQEVPELIFEIGEEGKYKLPRKVYGEGSGVLIVKGETEKSVLYGEYLFEGNTSSMEEETLFYECEKNDGDILWPIKATYRMFYLGARVRLAHSDASKESVKGARHIDKILVDLTGMLMGFRYERGKALPKEVVVKKSGQVVAMKEIDVTVLREKLLAGEDVSLHEMANISFLGAPGASQYEVKLTSGDETSTELIDIKGYDAITDSPRLSAYKEGTDYVVKVVGHSGRAGLSLEDTNDMDRGVVKIVDMSQEDPTFRVSEEIASQGMIARVSVETEGGWSNVAQVVLLDVSSVYGIKPEGVASQTTTTTATISYAIPRDVRFAGVRLYHEGKVVRDMGTDTSVTITALAQDTGYVFALANYDVDGFESEHVVVPVKTQKEIVQPELEPISLYVDNVKMTYKI